MFSFVPPVALPSRKGQQCIRTTQTTKRKWRCSLNESSKEDGGADASAPLSAPTGEAPLPSGPVRAPRPMRYGFGRAARGSVRLQGKQKKRQEVLPDPPGVRVAAGTVRGRRLVSPHVYLRPMMGKVREAVFSMLQMVDAISPVGTALDLYAGCGSVGIEALSRGMKHAVFVDNSPDCISAIEHNLAHCGFTDRGLAVCTSVEDVLPIACQYNGSQHYSLITITPPYEEVNYGELLETVAQSPCVGEGTFVVVEYPVELKNLPPAVGQRLIGIRNRRYGRTVIAIYACRPSSSVERRPEEFMPPSRR